MFVLFWFVHFPPTIQAWISTGDRKTACRSSRKESAVCWRCCASKSWMSIVDIYADLCVSQHDSFSPLHLIKPPAILGSLVPPFPQTTHREESIIEVLKYSQKDMDAAIAKVQAEVALAYWFDRAAITHSSQKMTPFETCAFSWRLLCWFMCSFPEYRQQKKRIVGVQNIKSCLKMAKKWGRTCLVLIFVLIFVLIKAFDAKMAHDSFLHTGK